MSRKMSSKPSSPQQHRADARRGARRRPARFATRCRRRRRDAVARSARRRPTRRPRRPAAPPPPADSRCTPTRRPPPDRRRSRTDPRSATASARRCDAGTSPCAGAADAHAEAASTATSARARTRDTRRRYAGQVGRPASRNFGPTRVNGKPVGIRHGRATVCGEPPARHSDEFGGRHRHEGTDPQVRIPSPRVITSLPPREKVGVDHGFSFIARARCSRRASSALRSLCAAPTRAGAQAAPAPSPTPSPVAEIGRVSTSDRQDEPVTATARATYVVTKAQMLRHGDTTSPPRSRAFPACSSNATAPPAPIRR